MSRRALSAFAPFAILSLAMFSSVPVFADPGISGDGDRTVDAQLLGNTAVELKVSPGAVAAKPVPAAPAIVLNANIDLAAQRMTVSHAGNVLHVWPISSGTRGHETPRGTFRPQWTSRMHFSKKYDNAPMPHSVFFNGGVATHATQATGRLGSPASHGCIRLHPTAAATFYALVHKHGLSSTRIVVHGSPRFRDEVASRRDNGAEARRRVAAHQFAAARSAPVYGFAPAYGDPRYAPGYAQPRRIYVQPRPVIRQVRYLAQGYGRY